jgi:hypothetical protein
MSLQPGTGARGDRRPVSGLGCATNSPDTASRRVVSTVEVTVATLRLEEDSDCAAALR